MNPPNTKSMFSTMQWGISDPIISTGLYTTLRPRDPKFENFVAIPIDFFVETVEFTWLNFS